MPGILTADVVAAVLAHFPEDHFKSTSTELQAGFRHIAEEFPGLLGHISFGKVGAYVSSPTIDAALDSLAASGFYSRYNKDLVTYELDKSRLMLYYKTFLDERFVNASIGEDTIKEAALALRDILYKIHRSTKLERLLVT